MAYNKFIKKDGTVLLDLTDTTVTAATLRKGVTAVDRSGNKITGIMEEGISGALGELYITDNELINAMLEAGLFPGSVDVDHFILTDADGTILMI